MTSRRHSDIKSQLAAEDMGRRIGVYESAYIFKFLKRLSMSKLTKNNTVCRITGHCILFKSIAFHSIFCGDSHKNVRFLFRFNLLP